MINQLIEKLEELRVQFSKEEGAIAQIRISLLNHIIKEAKQLQEKVRCENCRYGDNCSTCRDLTHFPTQEFNIPTEYIFCNFWEEKE